MRGESSETLHIFIQTAFMSFYDHPASASLQEVFVMSKQNSKAALKAAIITMSFVQMGTNGISPILAQIAAAFPEASSTSVQFLMTFPSIFVIVISIVAALLSGRLPKKTLALTGLSLVAAGGLLACLFHGNLTILFVWAAVLGIGIGMVAPIAPALVSEYFEGGERQTMLGIQNSSANIGSMLMTFFGGFLAAAGWWFGYLVYLLALPGVFCTLKGVPATTGSPRTVKGKKKPFRLTIVKEMLIAFFFLMLFSAAPANLSMLVSERGIGGTALAGTMSTLFLLGGSLVGFIYGAIAGKIGNKTIPLGALLLALGSALISVSGSAVWMGIGCLIGGGSISLVMPACMAGAGKMEGYETLGSALVLSSSNVGVFITPVLTSATAVIAGSDATSYRFIAVAVLAVVLCIITLFTSGKEK